MPTHPRPRTAVWFVTAAVLLLAGCGDTASQPEDPVVAAPDADADAADETTTDEPAVDEATEETAEETADQPDDGPTPIEVELRDDDGFVFAPADVTVEVGGTVTWVHEGRITHTATASDGSFASGTMAAGDTFAVTFDEPGTYPYVCDFHGSMRGTIEVS